MTRPLKKKPGPLDRKPKKPSLMGQAARALTHSVRKGLPTLDPKVRRKVAGSAAYIVMEKYGVQDPKYRGIIHKNLQAIMFEAQHKDSSKFIRHMNRVTEALEDLGFDKDKITRFLIEVGTADFAIRTAMAPALRERVIQKQLGKRTDAIMVKHGIRTLDDKMAVTRLMAKAGEAGAAGNEREMQHYMSRTLSKLEKLGLDSRQIVNFLTALGKLSEESFLD